MIDYISIVENLKDEDVFKLLSELGADPIDRGDYFICRTICHHPKDEEANHKLYYYKNTHLFYCYSNCGALSIFKLLREYYTVNEIEYDWYKDILQVVLNCSLSTLMGPAQTTYRSIRGDYELKRNQRKLPVFSKGLLDCFIKFYPIEWLKDGISKESMDKFDIRYSISQNKIIIPHFNANGEMIGIRGRALNDFDVEMFGKYMPVQIENTWYSHPLSLNLYGLNMTKENIKKTGVAFIFESEKSVLQLDGFKMVNCGVASCGSNLNKFQIDLLMETCAPREIVICYDNEEEKGKEAYFNKLYKVCKKYKNYCQMSFIYDSKNLTNLKDSPSDKGEEIFKKLLNERIKVK